MDKFEFRRLAFKRLVEAQGRGGQAKIASDTGISPNYVSRMLYPPGKNGRKQIGEDYVELLTKHYPGWLDVDLAEVGSNVFSSKHRSKREATIQEIVRLLRETDDAGLDVVLHSATLMADAHPISKQTQSSQ